MLWASFSKENTLRSLLPIIAIAAIALFFVMVASGPGSRVCVENPQYRFEHTTRRNRFSPRTSIGNILLRKMIPDAFPLLVREPNHSTFISDQQQWAILR